MHEIDLFVIWYITPLLLKIFNIITMIFKKTIHLKTKAIKICKKHSYILYTLMVTLQIKCV